MGKSSFMCYHVFIICLFRTFASFGSNVLFEFELEFVKFVEAFGSINVVKI